MTKCCKCKKREAIGYFGVGDPDIKPIPLCEQCKVEMQMEMFNIMSKSHGKNTNTKRS